MPQRIDLELTPNRLKAFRGENIESIINLRNRGQSVDQFTLSIEGLKPDWYSLPVSSVALFPNDQDKVKIIIRLPEEGEITESAYAVKIKVTSQEDPTDVSSAELTVEVGTAPSLLLSLLPGRVAGRRGVYQLSVTNPGDRDAKINIKPSTPQKRLRLSPNPESAVAAAGKQTDIEIEARLHWLTLLKRETEYPFQVAVVPVERADLSTVSTQTAITGYPWYRIFSKIRLPWLSRAPLIKSYSVTTDNRREFTFKWQVQRAQSVKFDGQEVDAQGETVVHPSEARDYVLEAGNRNAGVSQSKNVNPIPLPRAKTSDNIKITLSSTRLQAQAGLVPAILNAQIQNQSDIVDKFIVEVEGLDESWYSRSASSIALMPKTVDQVQIQFNPPKVKGVKSGLYPFAVTVRSQSNAQETASVLGQLEILPAVEVKAKVLPYRMTVKRKGSYRISLSNTGVSDAVVTLEATDLDEGCRFRFNHEKIAVGAWRNVEIPLLIRPRRNSVIGEEKRFDVTVTALVEGMNMPQTANCELTHRPLMKSWKPIWRAIRAIIAIAIVVVAVYYLLKVGGGWDVLRSDPRAWLQNWVDTIVGWFPQ